MPEEALGLEPIVRATEKLDVPHGAFAADSIRLVMMERDEGPLIAPPPGLADEGAPTIIARPDGAPDLGRNIPAARSRTATGARAVRHRELLPA
jgi:hypothetical protein